MSRIARSLITVVSLVLLAAVVSMWPSPREASAQGNSPGNSGGPVRVTVVTPVPLPVTLAGTPFQFVLCRSAAFNAADLPDCSGRELSMTLPPDRRAVIQLVSGDCVQRNVGTLNISLSTQVGEVRAVYPIHLELGALGGSRVEGALQGPIYADPGSSVGTSFGASSGSTTDPGSVRCDIAISGLLIANN